MHVFKTFLLLTAVAAFASAQDSASMSSQDADTSFESDAGRDCPEFVCTDDAPCVVGWDENKCPRECGECTKTEEDSIKADSYADATTETVPTKQDPITQEDAPMACLADCDAMQKIGRLLANGDREDACALSHEIRELCDCEEAAFDMFQETQECICRDSMDGKCQQMVSELIMHTTGEQGMCYDDCRAAAEMQAMAMQGEWESACKISHAIVDSCDCSEREAETMAPVLECMCNHEDPECRKVLSAAFERDQRFEQAVTGSETHCTDNCKAAHEARLFIQEGDFDRACRVGRTIEEECRCTEREMVQITPFVKCACAGDEQSRECKEMMADVAGDSKREEAVLGQDADSSARMCMARIKRVLSETPCVRTNIQALANAEGAVDCPSDESMCKCMVEVMTQVTDLGEECVAVAEKMLDEMSFFGRWEEASPIVRPKPMPETDETKPMPTTDETKPMPTVDADSTRPADEEPRPSGEEDAETKPKPEAEAQGRKLLRIADASTADREEPVRDGEKVEPVRDGENAEPVRDGEKAKAAAAVYVEDKDAVCMPPSLKQCSESMPEAFQDFFTNQDQGSSAKTCTLAAAAAAAFMLL